MTTPTGRPRGRDRPTSLVDRLRGLFAPAATTTSVDPRTGATVAPTEVVAWATRDLLRAESAEEVAGIVAHAIDRLGGQVVPAHLDDPDALPLDVSFGVSEPMLPTAPAGTTAARQLQRHLPGLVSDARRVTDTILRTAQLSADVATDPVTGLETRATFVRELNRLREHDAVVVVRVTVPEPTPGEDDGLEEVVRAFADHLRDRLHHGDHAARIEEDEFGVLLRGTGAAGTTVEVARLRSGWEHLRPDVDLAIGAAPYRDSGTASLRDAYDALDRELDGGLAIDLDEPAGLPDEVDTLDLPDASPHGQWSAS